MVTDGNGRGAPVQPTPMNLYTQAKLMKSKLEQKDINAEELKRAVGIFVKDGGIIQKLPDQKSVGHRQVGGKHAITELGGQTI